MVRSSLAASTRKSYRRFINRFKDFCSSNNPPFVSLPATSTTVARFIAFLHDSNFSASSICSHMSAISCSHKLSGDSDPCQLFIVQRMLLGCKKGGKSSDCRLPILKPMLHKLVNFCTQLSGGYDQALFQAILLVTHHGFFRIGEILPSKSNLGHKVVQLDHVNITSSSVFISLHNYKTRRSQKPLVVTIKATNSKFCPVKKLTRFISFRGRGQGPLFLQWDGRPVLISNFNRIFKSLLSWGNFPSTV